MTIQRRLRVTLLTALCLAMCLCTTAFADTDGTEPKITQQPDQLVLQLGTRWAGVEFELRTDAGVFPAPIVVDETGVLTMDLGGSTTYTLSASTPPSPSLTRPPEQVPDTQQQPDSSAQQPSGQVQQPQEQVPRRRSCRRPHRSYGGIFHRPCLRDRRPRGPLLRQAAPPAGRLRRVGGGG